MFRSQVIVLVLLVVGEIHARSEADIRGWFVSLGAGCAARLGVGAAELQALQQHRLPETRGAKCLLACVFRQAEFLDSNGAFDTAAAHKMAEREHVEDSPKLAGSKKLLDLCSKVNDEPVSDGQEGCDRSLLLTKCFLDNAAQFNLKIEVP